MRTIAISAVAGALAVMMAVTASAHQVPWRQGELRQAAFGHCAKGPCATRAVWAKSRPHRHVRGKVVFAARSR